LMELIMVMFIMTLFLWMVAPSFTGFTKSRKTSDVATLMQSLTNYGRTHAMSEGRNYRLVFDFEHRLVQLVAQDGDSYTPPNNDFGLLYTLPDGVDVTLKVEPQVETLPQFGQAADTGGSGLNMSGAQTLQNSDERDGDYIEFRSSGRTDPAVIEVINSAGGGNSFYVVCQSETEGFQIVNSIGQTE